MPELNQIDCFETHPLEIIKLLQLDAGKIYKQEVLKRFQNNPMWLKTLKYTYDPKYTYGIKKLSHKLEDIRKREESSKESSEFKTMIRRLDNPFHLLDRLNIREITGDAATAEVSKFMSTHDKQDAELLYWIIKGDLKCGIDAKSVFRATGIKMKPSYMGAVVFDPKKIKKLLKEAPEGYVFVENKADGQYGAVVINNTEGKYYIESRAGHIIPGLEPIVEDVRKARKSGDFVITGEVMVKGYDRFTANGIVNRVKGLGQKILDGTVLMKDYTEFQEATGHTYNEIQNLLYMITWDIISLSEYTIGKGRKPRTERLAEITKLCENTNRVQIIHGIKATTYEEICQFFSEQLALGLEGAIVKSSDGKWVDGKPVHQIKMKLEFVSDLRIVGFNEGKADTKFEGLLGSVQCESEDGLLKTDVSGFTDDEREYIWFHKDEFDRAIMGTKCNGLSKASDNEHFSMMYAVANRVGKELDIRTDKSVANTFEEIQQIESSKKNG